MASPCDTCAFREGSETFEREPYNRFRGQVAALSGLPFFCHHGLNWRKPMAIRRGFAFDVDGNVERVKVCEGWRQQVTKHIKPGMKDRLLRRGLGQATMDQLEAAIAETGKAEKKELWAELRTMFLMLTKAAGFKIKLPRKVNK
jgi:hypothetical protein